MSLKVTEKEVQDYIEKVFGESERNNYKTVFRSSQQITDFCAAIAASGALMFQSNYRNPYDEFFLSCAKKHNPLYEFRKMIDLKE